MMSRTSATTASTTMMKFLTSTLSLSVFSAPSLRHLLEPQVDDTRGTTHHREKHADEDREEHAVHAVHAVPPPSYASSSQRNPMMNMPTAASVANSECPTTMTATPT